MDQSRGAVLWSSCYRYIFLMFWFSNVETAIGVDIECFFNEASKCHRVIRRHKKLSSRPSSSSLLSAKTRCNINPVRPIFKYIGSDFSTANIPEEPRWTWDNAIRCRLWNIGWICHVTCRIFVLSQWFQSEWSIETYGLIINGTEKNQPSTSQAKLWLYWLYFCTWWLAKSRKKQRNKGHSVHTRYHVFFGQYDQCSIPTPKA